MNDIRKMEKVFQDAKDLNLSCLKAYTNGTALYADAGCTDQLTAAVAKEAFERGLLVIVQAGEGTTTTYRPVTVVDAVVDDAQTTKVIVVVSIEGGAALKELAVSQD